MTYNIVRIPKTDESLAATIEELAPFIEAMYTEDDVRLHGPFKFDMGQWLFLWDSGAAFFLTSRDAAGKLIAAAVCTRFRELWSGKLRVELHRFAFDLPDIGYAPTEIDNMVNYLIGVESILEFDELYVIKRTSDFNEVKELAWHKAT